MEKEYNEPENDIELEKIKFMYDKTYDELNRNRDWPIKVMSFVSGFFVLLIGFINLRPENVGIIKKCSYWIIGIISVITFWTILIIIKQHRQYLIYRNIQRKLQSKMRIQDIKINDSKIFPKDWTTFQKQNLFTGWQGWLFYVLFILGLAIITALIVINL